MPSQTRNKPRAGMVLWGIDMIFGSYPCCGGSLSLSMPERTPVYVPEDCPHCGAKVWHVLSRIEPVTYTEKDFLERYEVDTENKQVVKRHRDGMP